MSHHDTSFENLPVLRINTKCIGNVCSQTLMFFRKYLHLLLLNVKYRFTLTCLSICELGTKKSKQLSNMFDCLWQVTNQGVKLLSLDNDDCLLSKPPLNVLLPIINVPLCFYVAKNESTIFADAISTIRIGIHYTFPFV